MTDIILEVGTHEDKQWKFTILNFDLSNYELSSQIRDSSGVLLGSMSAIGVSSNEFTLEISSATSGLIPPGIHQCDVMATSIIDAKRVFITPIMTMIVLDRVTEPI